VVALAHLYRMHPLGVTELFELFFLGLLAGFEVAVHYGIWKPTHMRLLADLEQTDFFLKL
jgi:hypothetical protein